MTPKHIAVVNDEPTFLGFIKEVLEEEGYQGVFWAVGATAFAMIRDEQPGVVVLDVHMEEPDSGMQILEMMRLDRRTQDIPVIVCSADLRFLAMQAEHLETLNCVTLAKPFGIDTLLEKLTRFVGPPAER